MALETQGSKEHDLKRREQEKRNLGAGSKKNWKREQGSSKILVLENGARSKGIGNYQGARGKIKRSMEQREIKKEQRKLVKRSERQKMEGSRENGVKCRREQGA